MKPWYTHIPHLNSAKFCYENSIRACMIPLTEIIEHGHFKTPQGEFASTKIRPEYRLVGYTLNAPIRKNDDLVKWIGLMVEREDGAQVWFHKDRDHAVVNSHKEPQ